MPARPTWCSRCQARAPPIPQSRGGGRQSEFPVDYASYDVPASRLASSPERRVITAQWRRTQGVYPARTPFGSAAKILVQQAEQQVVLPDAVDAEVAPRQ